MRLLLPCLAAVLALAVSAPARADSPVPGGADASMGDIAFPGNGAPEPAVGFPIPAPTPTPVPATPAPLGQALTDTAVPAIPLVTTPTVFGSIARLRADGRAAIPRGAPRRVRAIIAAA